MSMLKTLIIPVILGAATPNFSHTNLSLCMTFVISLRFCALKNVCLIDTQKYVLDVHLHTAKTLVRDVLKAHFYCKRFLFISPRHLLR